AYSPTPPSARKFGMPEAADGMVVDHPGSLNEGIAEGASDEAKSALLQGPAHGIRFLACRGNILERAAGIDLRLAADKLPDIARKIAAFLLHGQKSAGVADGGFDFQAIADNSRIGQQCSDVL